MSLFNYLKNYLQISPKIDNNYFDIFSSIKNLQKKISGEPFKILISTILGIFAYIYLAGQIFCHFFGLCLPIFYFYQQSLTLDKEKKFNSLLQYIVIFTHLETASLFYGLFNFYFYHLKLLTIFILVYLLFYQNEILEIVYEKLILYDNMMIMIIFSYVNNFKKLNENIVWLK